MCVLLVIVHYPRHDMQHLLKEIDKNIHSMSKEPILIFGVGLGEFWAEHIGFLCNIKQLMINPNLFPYENMIGKITWPEELLRHYD